MYIKIPAILFLINLASSYRLEHQSDLEINSTSIFTGEIAGLTDSNYEPWRHWPDRIFPRFYTSSDLNKPSWTIITKSKTISPSDSQTPIVTNVYSSSSDLSSLLTSSPNLAPTTISDYFGDSSSIYLPPLDSNSILSSYSIESSFKGDDLHTSYQNTLTSTPSIDSSFFTISTLTLPQTSVPFSDLNSPDLNSNSNQLSSNQLSSIDRTNEISSTFLDSSIIPTSTNLDSIIPTSTNLDSIIPSSTINLPETNSQIPTTTPLPNKQHFHKTVIKYNEFPQGMKNTTIEFEEKLKKVFNLAYSRLYNKNTTNLNVQIKELDWSNYDRNKTLNLIYSVKLDEMYLDNESIKELLNKLTNEEIKEILNATDIISKAEPFTQNPPEKSTKPEVKLSELLSSKLFDIDAPYFWIMISLFLLILLICCFYLSILVCWLKHRNKSNTADFVKERKNQLSPISNYSSDTLNTDNFIRWRNRSENTNVKQQQKCGRSLFKDDLKTSSLNKLKRTKEGSSPSNEFEYISFSSDTTNSLQRDGSLNKRQIRHHPYNQDNRSIKKDLSTDYIDYQQDYQQDYHIPTIQKINQFNKPNSIKLLISRGVQSNLIDSQDHLKDNLLNSSTVNKNFPVEIPSIGYYGSNVSVLNLNKEKFLPLNQSDSSTTTTLDDKNEFNKFKLLDLQNNNRPNSRSIRSNSRSDSEPKRLIKKEIIEEFETTTTTTTFKNPNTKQLDNLNKDAQLNEQTQTIIKAIRDELSKFYSKPK